MTTTVLLFAYLLVGAWYASFVLRHVRSHQPDDWEMIRSHPTVSIAFALFMALLGVFWPAGLALSFSDAEARKKLRLGIALMMIVVRSRVRTFWIVRVRFRGVFRAYPELEAAFREHDRSMMESEFHSVASKQGSVES